ncbi:2-dehydro-3-deoxygalactonokinase [uncultured Cohaesibacter sp.]|uniref:2-dehydro-3-deoxygalactonokinase n=1 Tax=uncultured Cohaesibacter sp. TaxID=1002546 RepID=UPI0029C91569|nr:2-dehydro-3-deoxygalactonokinase [uncultured Cohaesibacter sp.]
MTPVLIGIDWGTTSFRATLLSETGDALDRTSGPNGILAVENNNFEDCLLGYIADWNSQYGLLPLVASGMITSRNGWVETPYLLAPSGISQFAKALHQHTMSNGQTIHFITGLTVENNGIPDVMRGEETELIGQLATQSQPFDLYIMPGTHSKRVTISDGSITGFQTFMTGEIFSALKEHTILGKLMNGSEPDRNAFLQGVRTRSSSSDTLLHELFSARTLPLFEKMEQTSVASYLSGLLIGEEVKTVLTGQSSSRICIIGRGDLAELYATAYAALGHPVEMAKPGSAVRGQFEIAKEGGLLS